MTSLKFEYLAQQFTPRKQSGQNLLLFVAPAADIRSWAGVPRKAFDYQHGFQRTLDARRVTDVKDFFHEDDRNISPTAVVIGLTGKVELTPFEKGSKADAQIQLVRLVIDVPALEEMNLGELVDQVLVDLKGRLPKTVVDEIEADVEQAVKIANRLQEQDAVDEAFGIGDSNGANVESEVIDRSYLADFYAQLRGYVLGLLPWPEEEQLRQVLYSILKPAIIVDGQHRVFGGSAVDEGMLFAVCAIPNATWADSVYQFVVINQKAKPIKPAFLNAIIATSLSTDEIAAVYDRLQASSIDVELAQTMERVNTDPASPFRAMIDFQVAGAKGFLQFPGMTRLANDFERIPRTHPVVLADASWRGLEAGWLDYFFALWRGVRKYFESADPRLWRHPTEDNPNNLLKIVSLQEVQRLMLDNWADSRVFKITSVDKLEEQAGLFWEEFPSAFFTDEWRKKGLQTSVGRTIIRDAITETRRNIGRKGWGHRRLGLFSD
jgi:hypothetical protein